MEQSQEPTRYPPTILLFLLLTAIWLLGHPFSGIRHDGTFYTVQALLHLQPEQYGHDLFFLYGSQDDFTIFTPIYAAGIDLFGLPAAMVLLLAVGYALWAGGAVFLTARLLHGFPFWLSLVLIFAIPGYYATDTLFRYAESFLTPRLIAEGLTMFSLALLLAERRLPSAILFLVAFAMHPLMALPGLVFACFYLFKNYPGTLLAAVALGATLFLLLASLHIPPFDLLLTTMDESWLQISVARAPFIFWSGWKCADWNRVLLAGSLLLVAGFAAQDLVRRAFLSALAVGATGLILFLAGTSLFHNVLLIQLQPYRWLWLTQLFSFLAAAWLVDKLWNKDQTNRMLLLGFLNAWLLQDFAGGGLAVLVCIFFIWHLRREKKITLSKTTVRLFTMLPLTATAWWLLLSWQKTSAIFPEITDVDRLSFNFLLAWGIMFFTTGGGILSVPCFLAIWRHGSDQRKTVHLGVTSGVLLLLALSLLAWNRQDKWNQFYLPQIMQDPIPSFSRLIPENATVYWENNLKMTWFVLGRASYATKQQLAGLVFNRKTAIEGKKRMERLASLGTKDSNAIWRNEVPASRASFEALVHVCHDPTLDFVVLSNNFEKEVIAAHFEKVSGIDLFLYDCATIRRDFPDTWGAGE